MKREKQTGFGLLEKNNMKLFGGSYLKSNPKIKRPLSTRKSAHLVLRSLLAKGPMSLLRFEREIRELVYKQGKKHGVKIYSFANAGNHLHFVILPSSRRAFNAFIRAISGVIARLVLGAERGSAKNIQFWEKRPFTRIVEWGREYTRVCGYLLQNTLEATGFIPYRPRKTRYIGSG